MDLIEQIRARGLTVAHVCREAKVSRATLYRMAWGKPSTIASVVAVARAVGLHPSQIKPELAE